MLEAARSFQLVVEIVEARADGNNNTLLGNGDDDLLAALEDAEGNLTKLMATVS